jgi:uncharacterized protein (TIGR03435 family)
MTASLRLLLLAFVSATPLLAQSPDPRPSFEVATIKANTTGSDNHGSDSGLDQIVITNWPLGRFIMRAYNLQQKQVEGPDSLDRLFFDVNAKYPPGTKAPERALMLQSLLDERFAFKFHRETKEMQAYALTPSKGGLKLKPVEGCTGADSSSDKDAGIIRLRLKCVSMEDIATMLGNTLGDVAVDRTGLSAKYNLDIRFTLDDQPSSPDHEPVPSLFTALEETAGLHLQRQRVPVPIIVVDHIATTPTEN